MEKSIGNRILNGTVVIVAVGIVAKFASFISEAVLAAFLGTSYQSDAYYMIWSVHAVVYPMMSIGIWRVFLPLYKSQIAKEEYSLADSLTNKSITFFTLISIVIVILLLVFAPLVVSVVAPGFRGETRSLCIRLVRISAPMYVFIISSAVYASVLQCHDQFLGSQIREVVSHIPTIVAAVFFYHTFGIEAMAVALVIASVLRLFVELPFVRWGYRFKLDVNYDTPEFLLMLKRLPSALISAGVAQINTLVDKAMASTLPVGTVSGLNYGHKLLNVFSGLLSSAIATAMYPQMIELISLNKKEELGKLIARIVNVFCVLMFPITIACVVFRFELVSAVFQRGAFDEASTRLTANVFAFYSLSLFFGACNTVISNIFYGHGDTKTPMHISILNLLINVLLNFILIHFLGVNGLALATSLSAIITFFARMSAVEQYVIIDRKLLMTTSLKVLFASVVSCFLPRAVFWVYSFNKYITLICSAVIGVAIYLFMMRILKIKEIYYLLKLIRRERKNA